MAAFVVLYLLSQIETREDVDVMSSDIARHYNHP